jgi:hypothetical protein
MKCNVGGFDKILRIVLGLALIGAGVYAQSYWGAIGLIPLLTGLFGFCPAYTLLGLSSYKNKE